MAKDMTIKISPDQVMFSNISKSKDGYNSARVVAKVSDNEYMSVSYEWEGNNVPDFAMNLMSFMQANAMELGTVEAHADEYEEIAKGKNPFVKDGMEEEDPKKKNKKEKKAKKKEKCADDDKTLEDE